MPAAVPSTSPPGDGRFLRPDDGAANTGRRLVTQVRASAPRSQPLARTVWSAHPTSHGRFPGERVLRG